MGIILPVITGLLLLYADLMSRKRLRKNVQGQFVLRLNASYKWCGFLCCFIGSFLLNAAIIHWNEEIALFASLAILLFFSLGIPCLLGYYNYTLRFDEKRISVTNWLGKTTTVPWADITQVKFDGALGRLKLYATSNSITVWQHSVGFVEFLRALEAKTGYRI